MTTFSLAALTDAVIAFKKGITLQQGRQLRDNLLAAMEGDATAVAAGVTLKDPALDTGAATTAGINWVALRTAGVAHGAVGSYSLLSDGDTTAGGPYTRAGGSTLAGSGLTATNAAANTFGGCVGTWRCMGRSQYGASASGDQRVTLWMRIS